MFGLVTDAEGIKNIGIEDMDRHARRYVEQCDANDVERARALRALHNFHQSLEAGFIYKTRPVMSVEKILLLEQIGVIDEHSCLLRSPEVREARSKRYSDTDDAEEEVECMIRVLESGFDDDPALADLFESQRPKLLKFARTAPIRLLKHLITHSPMELLYLLHRCGVSSLGNPYGDDCAELLSQAVDRCPY